MQQGQLKKVNITIISEYFLPELCIGLFADYTKMFLSQSFLFS